MLTNLHRFMLLSYKVKQTKKPTLASAIQGYWMVAITLIVGAILAGGVLFAIHFYALAYLVVGGVLGWLVRTVWMFQKGIEGWPLMVQILNWSKVDQLLNQAEVDVEPARSVVD